jgi:hypothetical protein
VPEHKDVISAVLGASVSIAGLLLVFCAFLFSQAAGFPATTPDTIINKFRRGAKIGIIPFIGALLVAGLSLAWFANPVPWTYGAATWLFAAVLVLTALYGALTILYYL